MLVTEWLLIIFRPAFMQGGIIFTRMTEIKGGYISFYGVILRKYLGVCSHTLFSHLFLGQDLSGAFLKRKSIVVSFSALAIARNNF